MGFLRTVESAALNAPDHLTAQALDDMGNCQNYGPFLGPYYNTGLIRGLISGTQKGTIILTIPHIVSKGTAS